MRHIGFSNVSNRYASLDATRDMLLQMDTVARRVDSRPTLTAVSRKSDYKRKSRDGRKPIDAVGRAFFEPVAIEVSPFKTVVPSAPYNLSGDRMKYYVRTRPSFMRIPGLGFNNEV